VAVVADPGATQAEAATPPKRLTFPVALAILVIMVILGWAVARRRRMGSLASTESPGM
jgi:hypothetical protein